ncbi:MAG: VWA domain-containing protein [Eubacteriales bacterium]|nr:VWA domain-containing protein [Eubacteriales bacterium]
MTVQNMWPLAFLILVPVIILLYILKQKAQDMPFSSIMLWQEIYKNLEAKTPFEKLKQNILMYLQILLMFLLIFALMAPVMKNGGKVEENIVLVVDTSASMEHLYEGNKTRLEESVDRAKKQVDQLSENAMVTLIACDENASVVYQGRDKIMVKKRLGELKSSLLPGTLNGANSVVNSLVNGMEQVQVVGYTDTMFESEEWIKNHEHASLRVENLYSKGENCSVCYVNYNVEKDGIHALCKVANYGEQDVTTDVSLYLNNKIVDVQSVFVKAGESEVVYFKEQPVAVDAGVVMKAELSEKDSLLADNSQSIEVTSNEIKKVLLMSKGNVFLEKALSLEDTIEVYKADDINVLNQTEDQYDLYVFDGVKLPEDFVLPYEDASCLFVDYEEQQVLKDIILHASKIKDSMLSFVESPVTEYVAQYAFGITSANIYDLPEWATPVICTENGEIVSYYGTLKNRKIGVIGFDIHNTDLALQTEYPIFMSQLTDVLLHVSEQHQEIKNFPESESMVEPVQETDVTGEKGFAKTGGRAIRNLILIVALLLLVIEWIVYIRQVNTSKKRQFLVVRLLLMLVIVCAMLGLSITKKQLKSETIFLVDVSDSMAANVPEIEVYLQQMIQSMPEHNMAGVVAFGKDSVVDQFITDQKVFTDFTVAPITTATNIEKAVQNACSLFHDDVSKQLVLITDGSENEGSMSVAATTIKGKDVSLYTIALEDSIASNQEVYIDGLDVPAVVHVGDHYNITVSVTSNIETNAVISLYAGRTLKGQQDVRLNKGRNQFVFEDEGVNGTIANYRAIVEAEEDTIGDNNSYVAFSQIEAKPRVLLVEGKAKEAKEFKNVLDAINMDYDCVTAKGVPTSVSELNQYKAIISVNVHHDDLRDGFDKALASYVKDFAGGYICIGGDNSYALGGYRDTILEEILPVNMDLQGEKEIPKMAMAMVIDQSGSMCSPAIDNSSMTGLDLAKQAALSGVDQLRETDEIGVLAFDDSYNWIVPIQMADHLVEIKDKIYSIAYGGGTSIYPAIQEAYQKLLKSDAKLKHIILLTDGQDGFREYDGLLNLINEAGITVSSVAVGTEADIELMQSIAEKCGGRYYYTDVNNSIPRIFAQEVYLSTNTYLINEPFYPTITSGNQVLSGVFDEGCPALYGYIAATPKQTADVLLMSDREDPILSTWQYGLGKTVAWNSDVSNEWTAEYATWENNTLLWSNLIHYVMTETELAGDTLEIQKAGNSAKIHYETKEYEKETKVSAVVTDEEGNAREVMLDAVKPGVFETNLDTEQIGIYNISMRKKNGEELVSNYNSAYANQYSAEYQFHDSVNDVTTFTKQANGTMISMEDSVWKQKQETVKSRVSLTTFFLILAILFLMFDIVIRRLSIDVYSYIRRFLNGIQNQIAIQKSAHVIKSQHEEKQDKEISKAEDFGAIHDVEQKKSSNAKKKESKKKDTKKQEAASPEMIDMNQLLKKKKDRE